MTPRDDDDDDDDDAVTPVLRGAPGLPSCWRSWRLSRGPGGAGAEPRATEAPLGSHAGQQGRCGLGVSKRQEVRESPVSGLAGRDVNQLTCNRPGRS